MYQVMRALCAVCISLWDFFGCLSLTLDILVALGNVSWILLLAAATRVKRFRHQDPQRRIVRWCDMLKHEFPAFFPDLVSGEIWRKKHIINYHIYSYFILILNHVWICLNGFEWSKTFKNHVMRDLASRFSPKASDWKPQAPSVSSPRRRPPRSLASDSDTEDRDDLRVDQIWERMMNLID